MCRTTGFYLSSLQLSFINHELSNFCFKHVSGYICKMKKHSTVEVSQCEINFFKQRLTGSISKHSANLWKMVSHRGLLSSLEYVSALCCMLHIQVSLLQSQMREEKKTTLPGNQPYE